MIARILVGIALVLAAGCARRDGPPDLGAIDPVIPNVDGAELYRRACASCHGISGRGDGPVADEMRERPTDLTRLAERHGGVFPREAFMRMLAGDPTIPAHGSPEMPVWNFRFGRDIPSAGAALYARRRAEALADHVESLQRPAAGGTAGQK